jgi:hypothetical protein
MSLWFVDIHQRLNHKHNIPIYKLRTPNPRKKHNQITTCLSPSNNECRIAQLCNEPTSEYIIRILIKLK